MSNAATHWAITQRGLSPATKLVLWQLCDRHNPDLGCFPSQVLLAVDCEMSRSSINTHLNKLEAAGLIRRVRGVDPVTHRQRATRYKLACEADFALPDEVSPEPDVAAKSKKAKPCAESGHGDLFTKTTKAESKKTQKPSPDSSESRVQNLDTNLVKEPLKEPLSVRTAETSTNEDFDTFWKTHPRPRNRAESQKAFEAAVALGESATWLIHAAKAYGIEQAGNSRQYIAQSDNWLARKGWQDFPDPVQLAGQALTIEDREDAIDRFWSTRIRNKDWVGAAMINNTCAHRMIHKGLVSAADLKAIGVYV
jgi:hypothetical protein